MQKFKEVEFKYKADDISLESFHAFCKDREKLQKYVVAFGPDHFYAKSKDPDAFCRHRVGSDMNQLTFKRKTSDANNFVRTEYNLNLQGGMTTEEIKAYLNEFGYEYNTSIIKACFVYKYDFYTLVYYLCYDLNMQEQGRFIEIEMAEDHNWAHETHAWESLTAMERICKPLGVSPQSRIRRSLFEIFRKDPK